MSINIIVGNILGLISAVLFFTVSFFKTKKQMLFVQSFDCFCGIAACIVLGTYSGAAVLVVCLIRNIITYFEKNNKVVSIVLLALTLVLGIGSNTLGWIGVIPVVASFEFAFCYLYSKNLRVLRLSTAINALMWSVHDILVLNVASGTLNFITGITALYNAFKLQKEETV